MNAFDQNGMDQLKDAHGNGRFATFLDVEKAARGSLATQHDAVPFLDVNLVRGGATGNVHREALFGQDLVGDSHSNRFHDIQDPVGRQIRDFDDTSCTIRNGGFGCCRGCWFLVLVLMFFDFSFFVGGRGTPFCSS
jgi:hypothetical protein